MAAIDMPRDRRSRKAFKSQAGTLPLEAREGKQDACPVTTCFIATGNAHKVEEIRSLLGDRFTVLSRREIPSALEPEETGATFEENARLKAVAWALHLAALPIRPSLDWVLADDSGLEVTALNGAPGVHSARFAALDDGRPGNSPDAENNAKLMRLLSSVPDAHRQARFRCVLALTPFLPGTPAAQLSAQTLCFEGSCPGRIAFAASGGHGFGYDPLFVPDGHTVSFAELGADAKNRLSHRARALDRLQEHFGSR